MYLDSKFNKNELSKIGILDIYIKRKLKYNFSKDFKIKINPKIQSKIINDWKQKKSIKTSAEVDNWLSLYEINYDEWLQSYLKEIYLFKDLNVSSHSSIVSPPQKWLKIVFLIIPLKGKFNFKTNNKKLLPNLVKTG